MTLTDEIINFLDELEDKPFNDLTIREYYNMDVVKLPIVAIDETNRKDMVVYGSTVKIQLVSFVVEIYAKKIIKDDDILSEREVIDTINEWLSTKLRVRFGFKLVNTSVIMVNATDKSMYKKTYRYEGLLSNDGYIYK